MGQPVKLIMKKGAIRKDGTSLIFLQYCHSAEKRVLLNTEVAIPTQYWNKKTSRISENLPDKYGHSNVLQSSLINKLRKAEDMVEHAIRKRDVCPMQFLKENFLLHPNWELTQMADNGRSLNVYENIDDYIKSKETIVKRCTINVINAMKNHLRLFENHRKEAITFDSFDMNFYEEFVKYLTYDIPQVRRKILIKGLKVNSVGKTIKHLKSFLNDRMRKRVIPFLDLTGYKVMEEDVDSVFINWKELAHIYHFDLTANSHLEKYRDLFVLGCLTGFRFSDYSTIKPDEIRNGMLYVNQTKTLTTVVVPFAERRKIYFD